MGMTTMYPCRKFEVTHDQMRHDLIRNLNIFPGQISLSKNTEKTHKNDKINVNTHILMSMIQ